MKTLKNVRINLVRHGNAEKFKGVDDFYRPLSKEGIEQAKALREIYSGTLKSIKIAFVSPAPRASCTIAVAIAGSGAPIVPLPELWTPEGTDGKIINTAFEKHGYTVARYFEQGDVLETCKRFGERAVRAIDQKIRLRGLKLSDTDIVIVGGHAVLLNFVGDALTHGSCDEVFVLRELPEAGIFDITLCEGKAAYVGYP